MRLPSLRRRRPLPPPVPSVYDEFNRVSADWMPYMEDWALARGWAKVTWQQALWEDDFDRVWAVHRLRCCQFWADVRQCRDPAFIADMTRQHNQRHKPTGIDWQSPVTLDP